MNEKEELINAEKIFHNPVAHEIMAIYRTLVPFGDVVDTTINEIISSFIRKKHELLLNKILSDHELICTVDVNDVEFIMNFKKTLDAVNRLSNNDKIDYLANLLKNGYMKNNRIHNDEFEEYLRLLTELSYREINYIFFLYDFENKNDITEEDYWYKFMNEFERKFHIPRFESYEIYKRISNTGIIFEELKLESSSVERKSTYEEYDKLIADTLDLKCFYTTDFFKRLVKLIRK